MCKKPLVTIITPSYNQGQFIEETILSVLNQSYANIEYIVIDGGSTDNTLEILYKYKNKIKYIVENDNGQSDAINKGFRMAKGEFVGWINSDDFLVSTCVERCVDKFIKNDNLGLVYGILGIMDSKGKKNQELNVPNVSLNMLLNEKAAIIQPGSFYRTCVVKKVGYLDESLHYVMDYDLWVKLLKHSEIQFINEIVAYFRIHDNSKTGSQLECFAPELHKVSKKYGASIYILPNDYLKQEFYKEWCDMMVVKLKKIFNNCQGKKIGIFGIGGHTDGMLKLYDEFLGKIDFNMLFIDSNDKNWGNVYRGSLVYRPEDIQTLNLDKIIISSFTYQNEIYGELKEIKMNNTEVIRIYEDEEEFYFCG